MFSKIILLLLVFFTSQVLGQNCDLSVFKNFQPIWIHCYNELELEKDVQLYEPQQILVNDNSIYAAYTIFSKSYINGFVVEKIDVETGKEEWSSVYFQMEDSTREFPSSINFANKDTLELFSFRESKTKNTGTIWYESNMSRWYFDKNDGSFIDAKFTDDLDSNNVQLLNPYNVINPHKYHTTLIKTGSRIKYLEKSIKFGNSVFFSSIITDKGHSITDTTIVLKNKFDILRQNFDKRLSSDRIFSFRISNSSSNIDNFQLIYDLFDSDWNTIESHDISHHFSKGVSYKLTYVNDSSFIVREKKYKEFMGDTLLFTDIYLFSLDGNLIEKCTLQYEDGRPIMSSNDLNYLINKNEKAIVLSQTQNNDQIYWEWFSSTGSGEIKLIGKIQLNSNGDNFIWNIHTTNYMQFLNENTILIPAFRFIHVNSNRIIKTPYLFSLSLSEIKKTVKTKDVKSNSISIYPNPTQTYIYINGIHSYKKFKIYDLLGNLVSEGELNTNKINISTLHSGYYLLNLSNKLNNYVVKIIIQNVR